MKEVKEAAELKRNLYEELIKIKLTLEQITAEGVLLLQLNPISIPIFQGLMGSAKISLLSRYVWYNDLLYFYNDVNAYNDWSNYRTQLMGIVDSNCSSVDEKKQNMTMITELINEMNSDFLGYANLDGTQEIGTIQRLLNQIDVKKNKDLKSKMKK